MKKMINCMANKKIGFTHELYSTLIGFMGELYLVLIGVTHELCITQNFCGQFLNRVHG